ncbi:MAG: hypothetical protein ABL957_04780 [Parvularculaceae bacterium]
MIAVLAPHDFAAAQAVPAAPGVLDANFPRPSPGKPIPQLGIGVWQYWNYEEPFIDLTKGSPPTYSALLADGSTASWGELWAAGHINKQTLYPRSLPTGAVLRGGLYRFGVHLLPEAFVGTYVLEWTGDADLRLLSRTCATPVEINCQRAVGANRVEATFDNTQRVPSLWEVQRIGPSGISSIRLYRKSNEAALRNGSILNPKFQALANRYKVLRFMNPQASSVARPFHTGAVIPTNAASYVVDILDAPSDAPRETNFETLFKVAVEARTAAWVHVAGLPGATAEFDSLPGGYVADPNPVNLGWLNACRTNLPAILASSDWDAYMNGVVQGLKAADYPSRWMFYFEAWNEVWNTAQPWDRMTFCAKGVSEALGQGQSANYGYGYLTAHAMVELDAALKRKLRRQAWTMVLAQQAAVVNTTKAALEGFKRYFTDRGVDPAPWLKHVGVSVQGYYFDSLSREHGFIIAASDQEHVNKLRAAILADPAGAARARADWVISSNAVGSLGFAALRRQGHQQAAEEAGAYFLGDFEGESHDTLPWYTWADPIIINWHENFITGPEGERVTRAWVAAMHAQNPNAIASNYAGIQPRDPEGDAPGDISVVDPWYDGYYGEANGRTRGLDAMLRP